MRGKQDGLKGFALSTPLAVGIRWCPEEDSNLHASRHTDLNRARLPIPPSGLVRAHVSGPVHAVNALFENRAWVVGYRRTCSSPRPLSRLAIIKELTSDEVGRTGGRSVARLV